MAQTSVSSKYQVVIPKEVRKKIKVKPGQKMDVEVVGHQIVYSPSKKKLNWPRDYIEKYKNPWDGVDVDKYLEEERNSWK